MWHIDVGGMYDTVFIDLRGITGVNQLLCQQERSAVYFSLYNKHDTDVALNENSTHMLKGQAY